MKPYIFYISIFLLNSCVTYSNELLEFESSNAVVIGGNKTNIKLIPTDSKKKKNVIVKIFHKNNYLDNKRITNEKYKQILKIYEQISIKDSSKTMWLDPPTLEIKYKNGNFHKDFFYIGIPKKGEKFREITDLILESANLKINDIN